MRQQLCYWLAWSQHFPRVTVKQLYTADGPLPSFSSFLRNVMNATYSWMEQERRHRPGEAACQVHTLRRQRERRQSRDQVDGSNLDRPFVRCAMLRQNVAQSAIGDSSSYLDSRSPSCFILQQRGATVAITNVQAVQFAHPTNTAGRIACQASVK